MSKRTKYTTEEKYEILNEYDIGTENIKEIANKYKINRITFYNWKYNYDKYGINGLTELKTFKRYSKELKELAVKDYISGEFSQREVVNKYKISNISVLQRWTKKYNGHREIKATPKGMSQSMTKGRVTSLKERVEIVYYCTAHSNDYQQAAEVYNVSYQQVYKWVKKYKSGGENLLKDRRGKNKPEEEITPEDRINFSIKIFKVENERLKAENAFLKKLEELERERL